MLNKEKIIKIKNRLDKWCEDRKLTLEKQQKGYIANILDEVREFTLANTDEERVAELCDIVIFSLNAIEIDKLHYDHLNSFKYDKTIGHILEVLGQNVIDRTSVIPNHTLNQKGNEEHCAIAQIIKICDRMANELGFDFYLCLNEKINEIESRSGKWSDEINKFVKDRGAFSYEEAEQIVKDYCISKDYKYVGLENEYYVFEINQENQTEEFKIKKWYAGNFEKCRFEDFNKQIFIDELKDYFQNTLDKAFLNFYSREKIEKMIPLIDMNYLSKASFCFLMDYSDYSNIREDNISDYNPNLTIRIANIKIDNFKELFPYCFILDYHYNKSESKEGFFIELICSNEYFDAIKNFIIELRDYVLNNKDKITVSLERVSSAKDIRELELAYYMKLWGI